MLFLTTTSHNCLWPYTAVFCSPGLSNHLFFFNQKSPLQGIKKRRVGTRNDVHNLICVKGVSVSPTVLVHSSHADMSDGLSCITIPARDIKNQWFCIRKKKLFDLEDVTKKWNMLLTSVSNALQSTIDETPYSPCVVRVLLSSCSQKEKKKWNFFSPDGWTVYGFDEKEKTLYKKKECAENIPLTYHHGWFVYKGKRIGKTVKLIPMRGFGSCDGIEYDGYFHLMTDKTSSLCINCVGLEEYICSVLRTESWPGWPLEVNKALAIACRSYVVAHVLDTKRIGRAFHVKNSNVHQTYCGRHSVDVLHKATERTRGIILGFNQKPVLAMFDSCCGGIVPARIADFDFSKVPYLARDYACAYCKKCSAYSWKRVYTEEDFFNRVKKSIAPLKVCRNIKVTQRDKAGLVEEITLQDGSRVKVLSGKVLYSLLPEVKSFCFEIKKEPKQVVVSGFGLGHHLGLCQWGAREMVRQGWGYKSILQFYYPHTHFMKLS